MTQVLAEEAGSAAILMESAAEASHGRTTFLPFARPQLKRNEMKQRMEKNCHPRIALRVFSAACTSHEKKLSLIKIACAGGNRPPHKTS
jgi:hypothetical protein